MIASENEKNLRRARRIFTKGGGEGRLAKNGKTPRHSEPLSEKKQSKWGTERGGEKIVDFQD